MNLKRQKIDQIFDIMIVIRQLFMGLSQNWSNTHFKGDCRSTTASHYKLCISHKRTYGSPHSFSQKLTRVSKQGGFLLISFIHLRESSQSMKSYWLCSWHRYLGRYNCVLLNYTFSSDKQQREPSHGKESFLPDPCYKWVQHVTCLQCLLHL